MASRATFAKNAFEAGGLEALDKGGFEDAATLAEAAQNGTLAELRLPRLGERASIGCC